MATPKPIEETVGSGVLRAEAALAGILALLAADRDDRLRDPNSSERARRTELVLADAGLTPQEISKVLNKKPNTVAKMISRARSKAAGASPEDAA
jgi:DNA-directed RNA polymerase specialized sigma24 family protein